MSEDVSLSEINIIITLRRVGGGGMLLADNLPKANRTLCLPVPEGRSTFRRLVCDTVFDVKTRQWSTEIISVARTMHSSASTIRLYTVGCLHV